MAECLLGAAGTPRSLADGKSKTSLRDSLRVVILDHQSRCLRLNGLTASPHELAQNPGNVRCGSVRSSPRSAQLPPVGAVPIPFLGFWIATPRFRRGTFHLARDHFIQLEPSESLGR